MKGSIEIVEIEDGFTIEVTYGVWDTRRTFFRETSEDACAYAKELIDKIYEKNWKIEEES